MADESDYATRPITGFSNAVTPLQPGSIVGARYQIERELGRGGVGVVYLALDQHSDHQPVVIKLLLETIAQTEQKTWFERHFRQEIAALRRINHPGVVQAVDVGDLPDGRMFLVMEFIRGTNLRAAMTARGMELTRAGEIIRQLGDALTAAHEQKIYHRDLKPENVMLQEVDDHEVVKLIDFGIATVLEANAQSALQTTAVAGTVDYMSPEHFVGKPAAAADIYALGLIAYELVTGRRPFNPDSPYQLPELMAKGVKVNPCALRESLPPAAGAVIMKALAYAPKDRYQSAREFGQELARALADETQLDPFAAWPVDAAAPTVVNQPAQTDQSLAPAPVTEAAENRRGRKLRALVIALAIVVLVALSAAYLLTRAPERTLSYWLLAQKCTSRTECSEPFRLADAAYLFAENHRVRLQVTMPQPGHFYVLNESMQSSGARPGYIILYPADTDRVEGAATQLAVPADDWFEFFDNQAGPEKLWLVWSERPVAELEAVKARVNAEHQGQIKDDAQNRAIDALLQQHAAARTEVAKDDTSQQILVKARGDIIAYQLKLEHR